MGVADTADVVVIGAGAAGLLAAWAAAAAGRRVLVLEQLGRPGVRLLATGGGRCNLTNTLEPAAFMARFGRAGRFLDPALHALSAAELRARLARLGVATHAEDGLHVFPRSESAADVQQALWRQARDAGATFRCGVRVARLTIDGGRVSGLVADGEMVAARAVVVATGGVAYPKLGGTGDGYRLVAEFGHTLVQPLPALVPILVREPWVGHCAGVVLPQATVWIEAPGRHRLAQTDAVLFTHRGLSGPAVLDLSGEVAARLQGESSVALRLAACPQRTPGDWRAELERWRRDQGAKTVRVLLDQVLPASLATAVAGLAGAEETRAAKLGREMRETLVGLLAGLPLTAVGTAGFGQAMVTRGGIRLSEVDPHTLGSRVVPGLFLAGEVLDVDGPCGGFNLQWAFSSGCLAGQAAAAAAAVGG